MTVQEMIDKLNEIEDKCLTVCIEDWNEGYRVPAIASPPEKVTGKYLHCSVEYLEGEYVCIGAIVA